MYEVTGFDTKNGEFKKEFKTRLKALLFWLLKAAAGAVLDKIKKR